MRQLILPMNKSSKKELIATRRRQTGSAGAFTLTELLVVVGVVAMLAAVLLSASFTTQERVLRAECASNLKQIGSAALVYAGENDDFLPIVSWKDAPPFGSGNPWQTYLACRMAGVGSRVITEGPYGLGLLFFGKAITDPKVFYCPSVSVTAIYAYSTYSEKGWPWPSIPPDFTGGNPYVRCGYNYYPQSRITGTFIDPTYGPVTLPSLTEQRVTLVSPNPGDPPQPPINLPVPLKSTDVDPTKAVSCDLLQTFNGLTHKTAGTPGGVNVLFGDGHVKWVPVRGNNQKGSRQPFDPKLWDPLDANGTGPGNDPTGFRIIMNGFLP
jgi:prepilin-type processing-associated H-X9-DG protein